MEQYEEILEEILTIDRIRIKSYKVELTASDYQEYHWHLAKLLILLSALSREEQKVLIKGEKRLFPKITVNQESQLFQNYFGFLDWAQKQQLMFSQIITSLSAYASKQALIMPANWGEVLEDYMIENNFLITRPHLWHINEDMILNYAIEKTEYYNEKIDNLKTDEKYEHGYVRYILLDKVINGEIDLDNLNVKQRNMILSSIIQVKLTSMKTYNRNISQEKSDNLSKHYIRANKLLENIKKGNIM